MLRFGIITCQLLSGAANRRHEISHVALPTEANANVSAEGTTV
jgi:hypothetical protein